MAQLNFDSTTVKKMSGDGIYDYIEINGSPNMEVFRVKSSNASDFLYSRKFSKIIGLLVQNHGSSFAAGVVRDPPKINISHNTGSAAKITITHNSAEFFTIALWGEN